MAQEIDELPEGFKIRGDVNALPEGFVVRGMGQDGGRGEAVVQGFNAAIPFGQRMTAALGSLGASAITGEPLGQLYDEARANQAATSKAHPNAELAGTAAGVAATLPLAFSGAITGAVPTAGARGVINAIPEGLSQVHNFVRGEKAAEGAGIGAKALNIGLRSGRGSLVAAPSNALYAYGDAPEGERFNAATQGGVLGAIVGGAIPMAGSALKGAGSLVTPKIDEGLAPAASLAQKYGIPVSFDQISSSPAAKNFQKVSQELPFSGQDKFRNSQMDAFNRALFKTVGMDANKFTPFNMDKAFTEVGREFDNLGAGKTFTLGQDFAEGLQQLKFDAAETASRDAQSNLDNFINNKIAPNLNPDGTISGEKLGLIRSQINKAARTSKNADTQGLLHDLENHVVDVMTSGDAAENAAFSATKQKYKNLLVLEPLAAKAKGGNISPSQLNNRVSQIYGRAHTRGNAGEIGELAQIGNEILPQLGGSDTLQKSLYAAGAASGLTGLLTAPVATAGAAVPVAGGLALNRLAQGALNRNQGLISKALTKEIAKLPPAQAKKLLQGNP